MKQSAIAGLALLLIGAGVFGFPAQDVPIDANITVSAGSSTGTLDRIPFAGQWWSFAGGHLAKGIVGSDDFVWNSGTKTYDPVSGIADDDASPLLKYDRWHLKTHGTNPGSAAAELNDNSLDHHVDPAEAQAYQQQGVSFGWWGHCNGWAASSLTEREPHGPIESNGVRFDVADLKGMLAEVFWGTQAYFTGRRYNDYGNLKKSYDDAKVLLAALNSGSPLTAKKYKDWYVAMYRILYDNPTYTLPGTYKPEAFRGVLEWFIPWYEENVIEAYKDLYPHVFHQIIVTHLKPGGLGVVFDMEAGAEVWNFPAHAYETQVTFKGNLAGGGKTFTVQTTLYYQSDGVDYSILGVVEQTENYTYELDTDANGKLTGGRWTGASVDTHPDFAWIPTYNPTGPDPEENSKIEYGKVLEILSNDHRRTDTRIATLHVNGIASDAHRLDREARTIRNPLAASGTLSFTTTLASGQAVDKVRYFRQQIAKVTTDDKIHFVAVRGDLEPLGDGSGADWALGWTGTESGRYLFVVQAFNGTDLVSYDELAVQYGIQGASDDNLEDNDSQATASPLQPGTVNLVASDEDWFKVTVAQGQTLTVTLAFQAGDLDAALRDSSGKVVARAESSGSGETLQAEGLAAGTYCLVVAPFKGTAIPYTLSVGSGTADDSYEENDTKSTAAPIVKGTYPVLSCNDDDWYKIDVAPGTFTVRIDFTHANGDLDLYLYNATKLLGKSDSTTNSEQITYSVTKATTLYIRVMGYQGAKNTYSLKIQ